MDTPHRTRLHGIELRYALTDLIHGPEHRVWQVKDLVEALHAAGFHLGDTPSKLVSDHLRTEVGRGRVQRVGWGRYRPGSMPDSTRRRIRKRVARLHDRR